MSQNGTIMPATEIALLCRHYARCFTYSIPYPAPPNLAKTTRTRTQLDIKCIVFIHQIAVSYNSTPVCSNGYIK